MKKQLSIFILFTIFCFLLIRVNEDIDGLNSTKNSKPLFLNESKKNPSYRLGDEQGFLSSTSKPDINSKNTKQSLLAEYQKEGLDLELDYAEEKVLGSINRDKLPQEYQGKSVSELIEISRNRQSSENIREEPREQIPRTNPYDVAYENAMLNAEEIDEETAALEREERLNSYLDKVVTLE